MPCNAPTANSDPQYFTVTHCFHPLYKCKFRLAEYSRNWGENRVYFYDDENALDYLPARWTDLLPPDAFTVFSKGKAYFSIEALIELSAFIKVLEPAQKDNADVI